VRGSERRPHLTSRSGPEPEKARPVGPGFPPRLGLVVAVLAVSWAAILIRWSSAPPLVIGTYRLGFASLIFGIAALLTGQVPRRRLPAAHVIAAILAAGFLAAHFALWIASLRLTTVASSVILVSTQPLFVAGLGRLFLKEHVTTTAMAGICIALAGCLLIAGGNVRWESGAWRGDLLALGGALAIAFYYLLVRRLRRSVDLVPLITILTPLAAAFLLTAATLRGDPLLGYPSREYGLFFLLALGPTAVGHTLLNWALRYMPAYEVNAAVLGEPLGATLLALVLLGEQPAAHVLAGGALVLLGITLVWAPLHRLRVA
jgi:drug/metabolite transporter (DMT)-like permease